MKSLNTLLCFIIIGLCLTGNVNSSNQYYVYGNDSFEHMPDGDNAYHPENYGSVLLGTANKTQTFYGTYNYYFITTYSGDIGLIDAVQASDSTYLSSHITGNTPDFWESWNAPDGVFAHVGANGSGGALVFDVVEEQLTSITVYAPAPYYCDTDNDGYIGTQSDGYCIGEGCIPFGCQAMPGDDCDDTPGSGAAIHPGASEICDGIDNDCNGEVDEGLEQQYTISGTVYYNGSETGTIYIGAVQFDADDNPVIVAQTTIPSPGPFTFDLPAGSYHIAAQMDTDNSGNISIDTFYQKEPSGVYSPDNDGYTITIPNCSAVLQNKDIYLADFHQGAVLLDSFSANFFSGHSGDMVYHDGYLWVCDTTDDGTGPIDIHKVNPVNGQLVNSYDLGIQFVRSLEWIGDDLWVSHRDFSASIWIIRQYTFDGSRFTAGHLIKLPSSSDWDLVWSVNIAWDGNILWAQERGRHSDKINIYKISLPDGTVLETIPGDQFGINKKAQLSEITDICFADGFLWTTDNSDPLFGRIDPADPVHAHVNYYTFDLDLYPFPEEANYEGMVKVNEMIYFLEAIYTEDEYGHPISGDYTIHTAIIDQCLVHNTNFHDAVINFGRINCILPNICFGDFDGDGDVDGIDIVGMLSCQAR